MPHFPSREFHHETFSCGRCDRLGVRTGRGAAGGGRRSPGHAAPDAAGDQRAARAVRLRGRSVDLRPERTERPAPHVGRRRRIESGVFAGRQAGRLQRSIRRQHRRVRRPGRRRHADQADVASGRGHGAGFTPDGASVLFTSARAASTRPLQPALHGAGRRAARRRMLPIPNAYRATYSPDGKHIAYNPLRPRTCSGRTIAAARLADLAVSTPATHAIEKVPQPAGRAQRRRPDVDRRHGLLPLGPQRRVQPLLVRHEVEGDRAADEARRLPGAEAAASPAGDRIVYEQAGYLHLFDPKTQAEHAHEDRRRGRPGGDCGRASSRARATSAARRCRRRARARRSSSAARSSPCRRRRAIRAI